VRLRIWLSASQAVDCTVRPQQNCILQMFHQSTAALDEPVSGCLPDPTDTHTHATLINPIRALRAGERQGLFGKWGVLESWETSTTVDENRVASIRQRMSHFVACAPLGAAGKGQDFYHGVGSAQFLAERKVASSSSVTEIQRRRGAVRQTGVVVAEGTIQSSSRGNAPFQHPSLISTQHIVT